MATDYESALRAELMAATRRPRRRRSVIVATGGIAVIILAVLLTTIGGPAPRPAAADVEVRHEAGRVIVRLTDRKNSPEEIERATDEAGLDVRVEAVPAGPSNAGRFVGELASKGGVGNVEKIETSDVSYMGFSLREDWTGRLTLQLGRHAEPDETYSTLSNAYAEGEPLACSGTLHEPLARVLPYVDGLNVRVLSFDGTEPRQLPLDEALAQGLGAKPITRADALSPTELLIHVEGTLPPPDVAEC